MLRKLVFVALLAVMVLAVAAPALAQRGGNSDKEFGTVYVSSQGLYYDTFVAVEALPPHGPFQILENGVTEFGPGDPGYLGGRWWVDDGDGIVEAGETFLCPLLGPGRETE